MAHYEDGCDALYFNWLLFGNSGFAERPAGSVLLNYTKRDVQINYHTKVIARASAVDVDLAMEEWALPYWHDWGTRVGAKMRRINVIKDDMADYFRNAPKSALNYLNIGDRRQRILDKAVVHHYAFRSEDDINRRLKRGTAGTFESQLVFKKILEEGRQPAFLASLNRIDDTALRDYWRRFLDQAWQASMVPQPPGTNLALRKPATQSSTSEWSRGVSPKQDAARLVSGVFSGSYNNHTDLEDQPWWQVDLGDIRQIQQVRIYNRIGDGAVMRRARRFALQVSSDAAGWQTIFEKTDDLDFGGVDGSPYVVNSEPPTTARYLRVQLLDRDYLHLDQVEVYGPPLSSNWEPVTTEGETSSDFDQHGLTLDQPSGPVGTAKTRCRQLGLAAIPRPPPATRPTPRLT